MKLSIGKRKIIILSGILIAVFITILISTCFGSKNGDIALLTNLRPEGLVIPEIEDDGFIEKEGRINKAFNVEDFGEQGNNGWMYKKGDANDPKSATKVRSFEKNEKYIEDSVPGLEIKKDFIHTGDGVAAILEWKVAQDGKVNVDATYVKSVNSDKNPSFPDGVMLYVYHEDKVIANKDISIKVDSENIVEISVEDLDVKKGESIYFVIDAKKNNAYDGGMLYATITDPNIAEEEIEADKSRRDNNANNIDDFGIQGKNGWYYQCGKSIEDAKYVSSFKDDKYLDSTTPGLEIGKGYIHPGANRAAILKWVAYNDGFINLKANYTKFEQKDGNPDWPDGIKLKIYHNDNLLEEKTVEVFRDNNNDISLKLDDIKVKSGDTLFFIVDANKNAAWDGGNLEVNIKDKSTIQNENTVVIPNDHLRTNNASVISDFGKQGNNGWFYQIGDGNNPFDAENIQKYIDNDKYYNDKGIEIKNNFIHPGDGQSAIVKWKVAQNGNIKIIANYNKFIDSDPNPYWADGTKVTLYHNNKVLVSGDFEANRVKEVFKDMSVDSLNVKKGDFITLVVNGNKNNAYDGGTYTLTIKDLDNPLGNTNITENNSEKNSASYNSDFGAQGNNGWYYFYGNNPSDAKLTDEYDSKNEKYFSSAAPGLEIKKDFIHPSTQSGAGVKWVVATDGAIDILGEYIKLGHDDSNPSYPDGVTINIYKNNNVLLKKVVDVYQKKDNIIPIIIQNINVKKNDEISFIVIGNENISYDGGKLNFTIQPANKKDDELVDNSRKNMTNLEKDFGVQGSNGWNFGFGNSNSDFTLAMGYNEEEGKYYHPGLEGLQIKKDFVEPSVDKGAVYKWNVAQDGKINILGKYVKFTHNDGNPSWPDGVKVTIYHNDKILQKNVVNVSSTNENINNIDITGLEVKKNDNIYFVITANKNNAWDGGSLKVDIYPGLSDNGNENPGDKDDIEDDNINRENSADLNMDFGDQGNNGWSFGYGNSNSDFTLAMGYNEKEDAYYNPGLDGLQIKKDFVEPAVAKGAVYKWNVGQDGEINILGKYVKFTHNDGNPSWPDGVKLTIYHNDKILAQDIINVSSENETIQNIDFKALEVKKNDNIYFIINANNNNAWDGGRLEVSISPQLGEDNSEEDKEENDNNTTNRENKAELVKDFGVQGSNGWSFGYGNSNSDFTVAMNYNEQEGVYYHSELGGLQIKKDFVEPAVEKGAVYKWNVGQDGKIDILGKYVKFTHNDGNPSWPDGVKLTIYHNDKILAQDIINVSSENETIQNIDFKALEVKKNDNIYFIINANNNNAWDGGRLEVVIE